MVKSLFFYSIVKDMKNSLYSWNEGRNDDDDGNDGSLTFLNY